MTPPVRFFYFPFRLPYNGFAMRTLSTFAVLLAGGCASTGAAPDRTFEVAVDAPAPVSIAIPGDGPWRLRRASDGKDVPAQLEDGRLWWIATPDEHRYRLAPGAPPAFPAVKITDVKGSHLAVSLGGREVLQYRTAVVKAPEGVDAVYDRGGYIHPLHAPDGRVVTNDFPGNHVHHHGVWFPWTSSEIDGRKVDFWNSKKGEGRVEPVSHEILETGPVFASFRARHRFVDLKAPGGPKVQLTEEWVVRVYAVKDRFHIDLTSTQHRPGKTPFVIRRYRYGGFGFRGPDAWEGPQGVAFLTSEGKTRIEGHATRPTWVLMQARLDGRDAAVLHMGSPRNFRHPQPVRIHPDMPFFNWAPSQAGDFSIEPGTPYVSSYRMVVSPGAMTAKEAEAHWQAYTAAPRPAK